MAETLTAAKIVADNKLYWASHPEWVDLSPLLNKLIRRIQLILFCGDWPTRDAAAPEEDG